MPTLTSAPAPPIASPAVEESEQSTLGASTGLYAVTIFLSAFLMFQVQLILGKYILPWFGGSPSVWNTCLLLFQLLLFAGYSYAHAVSRMAIRPQLRLHLSLLVASLGLLAVMAYRWTSPITPGAFWKPTADGSPVWQVLSALLVSVGLPFLILSTTGPLLQIWFSRIQRESPYRLYALSNLGSLLGLLSYPFLEERFLFLRTQAWLWSVGYVLFLAAYGACAWILQKRAGAAGSSAIDTEDAGEKPRLSLALMWLILAACASSMLLATTNLICQEIAVIPLLWVLPLCIYLTTFIICFENERWYRRGLFHLLYAFAFFAVLNTLSAQATRPILLQIGVYCLALFSVCMVCHGELARRKPARNYLSTFYLMVASGGALGSILVVLIAPRIFRQFWEFQLSLLFCGVLLVAAVVFDRKSWFYRRRALKFLLAAIVLGLIQQGYSYLTKRTGLESEQAAYRGRNFFGVKTVVQDQMGNWLLHGRTAHGVQLRDPAVHDEPSLYYKRLGGAGLLFDHYPQPLDQNGKPRSMRVGIVGLGAGTLAAYGHRGDTFRFYEIDPQVAALSLGKNPWFSFLQDSPATIEIVLGDARLSLEKEAAAGQLQKFDVLVLDAFSSDSIPVHLLTKEAMALYLRHLSGPDAVVAFHLSNRSLDLRPVADILSREYGMTAMEVEQPGFSDWILASTNPRMMEIPELKERGKAVTVRHAVPLWTDEYSNLFEVLLSTQQ